VKSTTCVVRIGRLRLDGPEERLGLHDHPNAAAERGIVGRLCCPS
jgi:hypothetical protein